MKAESDVMQLGKRPGGAKQVANCITSGEIAKGITDLGMGHPGKQRRHDAKGANTKSMDGLHGQQKALGIAAAYRGEFGQLLFARQKRQYLGGGRPKGNFLFFEQTAQAKTHGIPFSSQRMVSNVVAFTSYSHIISRIPFSSHGFLLGSPSAGFALKSHTDYTADHIFRYVQLPW